MTIDSRLWDCASESIMSAIAELHKDLGTGSDLQDLQDKMVTYTQACRSMAIGGTVMREGTEVEGKEALTCLSDIYTKLQQSVPPPHEDEATCPADLLASQHLRLRKLTRRFMDSAADPALVKNITKAVRLDAITARDTAISDMRREITALIRETKSNCTDQESKNLLQLSRAAVTYAERAKKVNGPTVDLITTGGNGISSHSLEHYGASQLMGAMSYDLKETKLKPCGVSSNFQQDDLDRISRIEDSILGIENATYQIMFAHQQLGDTGEEECGDLRPRIDMSLHEYWDSKRLYEWALRRQNRSR